MKMKKSFSVLELRVSLYKKYRDMSAKTKPTKKQLFFRQKLELMTRRPDFQEEVRFFRTQFGIPREGFADDKCLEWAKSIISDAKMYAQKDPLRAYAKLQEGKLHTPLNEYENTLRKMLRTFGIRRRWLEAVEYYLLFNKLDAHEVLPKSVEVAFIPDEITGENTLCLRISTDTEQRDILDWWSTIENFQGIIRSQGGLDIQSLLDDAIKKLERIDPVPSVKEQKSKKDRERSNLALEKGRRAYLLKQRGKNYREIAQAVGIAQGQVGTYIKRFKILINEVRLD